MRVLVSVASKHGATAEIGEQIAEVLAAAGHEVVARAPQDVADLDGIDAVVLGSAVYVGRWMAPARELVERLGKDLARRPVWLFSSGPVGDPPRPAEEPADGAAAVEVTGAIEHKVFAGRIDRTRLAFGERTIVRTLHIPDGDFRDREEIADWARSVARRLDART
jgi:menaquinone-dependent protoporphyrinogen oxidase